MGDSVCEVLEAMLERLCDLENCDPYLYCVQKEELENLYCLYCTDPDLTIEKVKEILEGADG